MPLKEIMVTADIAALWDSFNYNSGFIAVKPTDVSKRLYHTAKTISNENNTLDDQMCLNKAIEILTKKNAGLNIVALNKKRFLSGLEYFEKPQRWLATEKQKCDQKNKSSCACVIHNNWIVSKAAKVYRFREHLMWMYDGDDRYYTSNTRLYLTYINHVRSFAAPKVTREAELSALKTAMTIGYFLNRTVILPKFHVYSGVNVSKVPLNFFLYIASFDNEFFGSYRESSFLLHPKVPFDVKSGLFKQNIAKMFQKSFSARRYIISEVDLVSQFGNLKNKVLVFKSLHNIYVVFKNSTESTAFKLRLSRAFVSSSYRQHKRW